MFRDKEILTQVLNIKTVVHHLDLAVKDIHCQISKKHYPKYDHEINASCDNDRLDLLTNTIKEIEERYAQEVASISIKIDQIFNWMKEVSKANKPEKKKPKKDPQG